MAASTRTPRQSAIQYVQIDGLVVMKIVKHCQEETAASNDLVQGVLLGLVVESGQDKVLEITNCFPFPRHTDDDPDFDEVNYQMEMMRNLRHVNIDHLHVGWYQSTYLGSFINRPLLDSQFNYQHSIEESVVLIYDPEKTTQGHLGLKAYRLTEEMMQLYLDQDFSPELMAKMNMSFNRIFKEVPIVLRNSHLTNVLLSEIEEKNPNTQSNQFLDLSTQNHLEKNVKQLMSCVDDLSQDCNKYINYMRQQAKQNQAKQQYQQKRQLENEARKLKGEPPLPEEELNKIFKPVPAPPRLDGMLTSCQIDMYAQQINEFAAQSFGKLFMAEALQEADGSQPNA